MTGQQVFSLSADNSVIEQLFQSKVFPQLLNGVIDFPHGLSQLFRVDCEREPASGTNELRIVFKPSNRLLNILGALRAGKVNPRVIE